MGIVGGAIMPPIMGRLSDMTNIQVAYLVPGISFVAILWFGLNNLRVKKVQLVGAH
jgi:FHS family L-fucose permease-like MFS transporter